MAQGSREDAIRALINFWLKDPTISCGSCGSAQSILNLKFTDDGEMYYECCDNVCLGDNKAHMEHCRLEIERERELSKNKFSANSTKTMRLALKMPPGLLLFLERAFPRIYHGEQLFNKKYDVNWFCKKFKKEFSVPQEF